MKAKYNEKLVEAFSKMSDEQKAEFYKPQSDKSYEEIQQRLKEIFCPSTPAPEKAVIEGWLSRSKSGNKLIFSDSAECKRGNQVWYHKEGANVIDLSEIGIFDEDIFPSITWESEPQRVRIEITLIDEKGE